jgi:hypothetical protein
MPLAAFLEGLLQIRAAELTVAGGVGDDRHPLELVAVDRFLDDQISSLSQALCSSAA